MTTRTNFILIDFENIQPKDLSLLKEGPFKVKVFLGPNQSKIPISLAVELQPLGENAEYIIVETAGNNALDFHIAYHIGALSTIEPKAFFHIISKDTGFDSLIKYLKGKKIQAQRYTCVGDIPYFKPTPSAISKDQIETILADLARRKNSKPRTQKTLLSTIHSLFKKELSDQNVTALFSNLCERGIIKIEDGKVLYTLPAES